MTETLAIDPPTGRTFDAARIRTWLVRLGLVVLIAIGLTTLVRNGHTFVASVAALTRADPALVALTVALAASTYLGAAIAIIAASGRRLPLGRTIATQLAAACSNRIAPAGIGAMATNLWYLERNGAPRTDAVAAIGLTVAASFVVHALITALVLLVAGLPMHGSVLPATPGWPWELGIVIVLGLAAYLVHRFVSPRALQAMRSGWADVHRVARSPRRCTSLILGSAIVTLGHGLAFVTAAAALGITIAPFRLVSVFLAGSAVAAVAPTPGGLGPLEAALTAGLTALGAPFGPALSAVLTFRLITYWLPVVPGAVALRALRTGPRDQQRVPIE